MKNSNVERLAEVFECGVGSWLLSYLGLPLSSNPKAASFWNPVIERIEKRLDSWKKAFVSRGDRLTLIQPMLNSLPTYYFSLFRIPLGVANKLEGLMRNFL